MVMAFTNSCFAIAILVNSLLAFCNASAVLFPVGMFPWRAIVRSVPLQPSGIPVRWLGL
jgi:hypothetical protein